MIKKISCILLSLVIGFTSFQTVAFAKGTNSERDFIYQKYTYNEEMLDKLFSQDSAIGYWSLVNKNKANKNLNWAIDAASKILDKYPEEKDYVEILANLIMMQSGDIAEQIQTQSRFDDLKDGMDYAMDIIDIAAAFIGAGNLLENVSPIIDAVEDGKDVIIESIEQAKYYETTIQDYSQAHDFLSAVSKYAKNKELRDAASSLLSANDALLKERLEYLTRTTDSFATYEAKFFVENMSFKLLQHTELYNTDDTVKWYVDCGAKLADSILSLNSTFKFTFEMMMLAGDIGFGTSDTFYRYQEMKTIADIAEALVKANEKVKVSGNAKNSKVFDSIQTKCSYYKMLIATHARGEYLIYQLLVSDAGVLSELKVIFDSFKEPGDTTKGWYDNQIDIMLQYHDILDEILCSYSKIDSTEQSMNSNEVQYEVSGNAFDTYLAAVSKTTESGSWTEDLSMQINMVMKKGTSKTKTKVTLNSFMEISDYSSDDISNLTMSGDATMSIMGQTYAWNMLYENGVAHYQYTEPNQTSADMKMDPNYFNFSTLTGDMLSDAKVMGNKIEFTVDGNEMEKNGLSAVNFMNGISDLEYGDVKVAVTVDEMGGIDIITMEFDASLTYQGYETEADYEVTYNFS